MGDDGADDGIDDDVDYADDGGGDVVVFSFPYCEHMNIKRYLWVPSPKQLRAVPMLYMLRYTYGSGVAMHPETLHYKL